MTVPSMIRFIIALCGGNSILVLVSFGVRLIRFSCPAAQSTEFTSRSPFAYAKKLASSGKSESPNTTTLALLLKFSAATAIGIGPGISVCSSNLICDWPSLRFVRFVSAHDCWAVNTSSTGLTPLIVSVSTLVLRTVGNCAVRFCSFSVIGELPYRAA